ncbi:MoaF C-terminal domain-containing protein [Mycobacterium sp. AT1]|uniref:MoaF C-terminal domain-containing protein n=1 Tax=Mycobacterium sp. AT1 TaxID=1961706 RepID=UPI0009AE850B|nr:MoaF C-terminal domain-containing protein [Mycobacterium sp. AT1]OPX10176.1 hypothetical protein B1790_13370 [Mycobacterium sp. AT1]
MSTDSTTVSEQNLGLGDNFAANKAERSGDLAGRELVLLADGAPRLQLHFHDDRSLSWSVDGGATKTDDYEALLVDDGLYLVAVDESGSEPAAASAVIVDLTSGHAVWVRNELGPREPNTPTVRQRTEHLVLGGTEPVGEPFAPTTELAGVRAMWVYSEQDVYEHLYLNSDWYVWHCLKGAEYPLADTDPCVVYKLRDQTYLLTFSEKVITMGASMVLDFGALRSYCAAFGSESDAAPTHFTFGAYGRVLSKTEYPNPLAV